MTKWKMETRETNVADAFSNAVGEIRALADEMQDWKGNMEGTNLESTSKYEEVTEAAEALETAADALEYQEDALPTLLSDKKEGLDEARFSREDLKINVQHYYADTKARWRRLANALNELDAVIEWLRRHHWGISEKKNLPDTLAKDMAELADELDTAKTDAEGVSFPGMY